MGCICSLKGCEKEARWYPHLHLYAKCHSSIRDSPASGIIDLPICDEHSRTLIIEDIVTDKGWEVIVQGFTERGYAEPDRNSIVLGFISIDHIQRGERYE